MGYTSAAEDAKKIRAELKALGWNRTMVSVRSESYSMGSSIRVWIKHPDVDAEKVKEISGRAESIARCEYSGEILSGGNRYVFVDYTQACIETAGAAHLDAVKAAVAKFDPAQPNTLHPVEGTSGALIGRDHATQATVWVGGSRTAVFYPGNEAGLKDGAFLVWKGLREQAA